ncbi:MAG: diacylglycerol kinase family protein [Myxococcota bacterium]
MKILIVANPISGGRQGSRRVQQLVDALSERGASVELHWTTGPGDALERARSLEAGVERLVVAGGDGTLNEVLNGLVDPGRIPVAQLPLGTANLLGHEFHLPRRADRVAEMVLDGGARHLDVGLVGDRRFLAVVSCGFDAMVVAAIQRTRSGSLGYRGYLAPIARALLDYRPPKLRVSIDGLRPRRAALVVVSNVRNYGGLFSVTDRANAQSGVLDVCIFPEASLPRLLRYLVAGLAHRISQLPEVVYRTGRTIAIESDEPTPVQIDGDPWGTTPVHIELAPFRMPFVAPGDRR